jgi:hypothetical protein
LIRLGGSSGGDGCLTEEPENEAGLREIPASEILDKIQKGEPVEYDHVRIVGDLDLSKIDLSTQRIERTDFQKKMLGLTDGMCLAGQFCG